MAPTSPQGWISLANERAADAEAINKERPNSVGCVYMAGYAIECSLKALLQSKGKEFPKHGREGHHLVGLWKKSGFKLSDLEDNKGNQTFFLEQDKWNTALRYESSFPSSCGLEIADLIAGAKLLTGKIQTQVRRSKLRKNK
jgi:hypothetical protein